MKRIVRSVVVLLVLLAAAIAGGSLYMLSYSLTPDATMQAKNASSYEYMYGEYPFLRPWGDSLERAGALRDTVIAGSGGERLHALYAAAPRPTDRTAVIVHGYTDNAVRMLMIGYLYNHDLGYNILLPDLSYHGQSEGRAIQMGWKDRLDVLRWMDVREELHKRGVSSEDSQRFTDIITRCDEAQYSPVESARMNDVYSEGVNLISRIESVIKR